MLWAEHMTVSSVGLHLTAIESDYFHGQNLLYVPDRVLLKISNILIDILIFLDRCGTWIDLNKVAQLQLLTRQQDENAGRSVLLTDLNSLKHWVTAEMSSLYSRRGSVLPAQTPPSEFLSLRTMRRHYSKKPPNVSRRFQQIRAMRNSWGKST